MSSVVNFAKSAAADNECENGLIASIYRAAMSPGPWDTLLTLLCDRLQLSRAIAILDRSEGSDHGFMVERALRTEGHELRHRRTWPHLDCVEPPSDGRVVIDNAGPEVDPAAQIDLPRSAAAHVMAVQIGVLDRPVQLHLYRGRRSARFGKHDIALLERLVPHISGALEIADQNDRLKRTCDLHDMVMNRVQIGLVVIDAKDEVVSCNQTANAMIAAKAGVRVLGNRIDGYHPADSALLKRLIASARNHPGEAFAGHLSRPSENRDICVFARSMSDSLGCSSDVPEVAIFLRDMTVREAMEHKTLMEMFDLTKAEVRLAAQFAVGCSVAEAASSLGIQLTTARGHLRSIFVKTGVNRQSELMRLLLV